MGFLEETILIPKLIPRNFDAETSKMIIDFLMRYIDDDILVLPEIVSSERFLEVLNSMDPSIQFTVTEAMAHVIDNIRYKCTNFLSGHSKRNYLRSKCTFTQSTLKRDIFSLCQR